MPQILYNTDGVDEPGADDYLLVQVNKGKRVQRNGINFLGDDGSLMVITEMLRRHQDQGKKYGHFFKVLKRLDEFEINTIRQCRSCGNIIPLDGFDYTAPDGAVVKHPGVNVVMEKLGPDEDTEEVEVYHCPYCDSIRVPPLLEVDAEFYNMEEEKRLARLTGDGKSLAAKRRRARKKK